MTWLSKLKRGGDENGPAFECRPLRLLTYLSWVVPVVWFVLLYAESLTSQGNSRDSFCYRNLAIPLGVVLASHGLYYLHLLAWRFQVSLLAFCIAVILWGNAVAWSWVQAGTDFGITVALGGAVYIGYALTWSTSIARLLGATSASARAAVAVLGFATPPAVCGLAFAIWWWWWIRQVGDRDTAYPASGRILAVLSCVVLAAAAIVSWRARRAARTLLRAACTSSPGTQITAPA